MEGMLSDPKKWNEAVQSSVLQETFEGDDAIARMDMGHGLISLAPPS